MAPRSSMGGARQEDPSSALLPVEGLIHGPIAAEVIDRGPAIEIVNVAVDAQLEIGHHRGDDPLVAEQSVRSLTDIENALRIAPSR